MVVKAVALSLREHPAVNGAWMGDFIRRNEHVNIGVAVAVDEGLLVPLFDLLMQKEWIKYLLRLKILHKKLKIRNCSLQIGRAIHLRFQI